VCCGRLGEAGPLSSSADGLRPLPVASIVESSVGRYNGEPCSSSLGKNGPEAETAKEVGLPKSGSVRFFTDFAEPGTGL
jgi:hypothetical protein